MEDTRKSEGLKALGAKTQYKMDYAPEQESETLSLQFPQSR